MRSIEVGRRKLTDEVLDQVSDAIGGKWNSEAGLWEFAFKPHNMAAVIPLTRELSTEYRHATEVPPGKEIKDSLKNLLSQKVKLLLDTVEDACWYPLFLRLEKDLDTRRAEFNIKGQVRVSEDLRVDLAEHFSKSRLAFIVVFDPATGKIHQFTPVTAGMVSTQVEPSKKKSVKRHS